MTKLRLAIGSDHGGLNLKSTLKNYISETRENIEVSDFGTDNSDSVDYPDFGQAVAKAVQTKEVDLGILVCGTGIGISISANRFKGVRAALVYNDFTAEMAKEHNNANILCLGERTTSVEDAKRFLDIWLDTEFGGDRHQRRVDKLDIV